MEGDGSLSPQKAKKQLTKCSCTHSGTMFRPVCLFVKTVVFSDREKSSMHACKQSKMIVPESTSVEYLGIKQTG